MNENEKDLPEEEIEEELPEDLEEEEESVEEEVEETADTEEDLTDLDEESFDEEPDDEEESEEEPEPDPEPEKKEEPGKGDSELQKKYDALLRQGRRTLKTLGVTVARDEDVFAELQKLAAENSGKSLEEYLKDADEEDEFLEFKKFKERKAKEDENAEYERIFERDLKAIHDAFPETKKYKHIRELPNAVKFADLMDSGKCTAVEAFRATHPDEVASSTAKSVRQSSLNDTKKHLTSNVPKRSKSAEGHIPEREMEAFREMFPDLDDSEIRKLYRKSTK